MKKLLATITLCLALIFTSALPILASDSNINDSNLFSVTNTSTNTVKVSKVTLNTRKETIDVGSTTTLIPTVYPDTATNKNVTWKSSNKAIANVDSTGKVYGRKAGSAVITSTTVDGKKKATCKVTVSSPPPTITSVSVLDNTIIVTLSRPTVEDPTPVNPSVADFSVTSSGVEVIPTGISTYGAVVTLTLPTVVTTATDQPIVYSVSYKGGASVLANIQITDKTNNTVKIGQNFNVVLQENGSTGYLWAYTVDNEAIELIKFDTYFHRNVPGAGVGAIWTFCATRRGSFNMHFSYEHPWIGTSSSIQTIDYIINVT